MYPNVSISHSCIYPKPLYTSGTGRMNGWIKNSSLPPANYLQQMEDPGELLGEILSNSFLLSSVCTTTTISLWQVDGVGWSVHCRLSPVRSPAKETAERRLGRGQNPPAARLRCGDCGDGASALRAHVPLSTEPPSRTSALPVRFVPSLLAPLARDAAEVGDAGLLWPWSLQAGASCLRSLCRLQRNEPGWFVGEHMQD
jgi:hypothetical protein